MYRFQSKGLIYAGANEQSEDPIYRAKQANRFHYALFGVVSSIKIIIPPHDILVSVIMASDDVVNLTLEVAGLCLIFFQLCVTMYWLFFTVNNPKVVYLKHDKTIQKDSDDRVVFRLKKKKNDYDGFV